MYYVGLDIHQRSTSVEILDCNGKLVKRGEWKLPWPELADQLKKDAPAPFGVCFEASCGYGYLYEQFSKVAQMVKAAHPGSLWLISPSSPKTPARNKLVHPTTLLGALPPNPRLVSLFRQWRELD